MGREAEVLERFEQSMKRHLRDEPPDNKSISWPEPLDPRAFHGLPGEIARAIEPHSEADPAGILVQALTAFGALVGRGPHVRVESDEHHPHLFVILVGDTSKARKGTSWARVAEIYGKIAGWPAVVEGLSSGEGLKYAVRDAVHGYERDHETKATIEIEINPGVSDKRLLVLESEFAQVLRQCARPTNTLSATIRLAWDGRKLQTLTKNDPVVATGAHISIIGHITADELRVELTATDSANGFANRFLFMCVRRSKTLPFGGGALDVSLVWSFTQRIAAAAERARRLGEVRFTDQARDMWIRTYPTLSQGYPGLVGAVTARAEAQCLRLALLYTLLDGEEAINEEHLAAAIALWERCDASAQYIFGSAVGDPIADNILRALRAAGGSGLARTDVSNVLKRHVKAERITAALELLERRNLAQVCKQHTAGRDVEIWRCT